MDYHQVIIALRAKANDRIVNDAERKALLDKADLLEAKYGKPPMTTTYVLGDRTPGNWLNEFFKATAAGHETDWIEEAYIYQDEEGDW